MGDEELFGSESGGAVMMPAYTVTDSRITPADPAPNYSNAGSFDFFSGESDGTIDSPGFWENLWSGVTNFAGNLAKNATVTAGNGSGAGGAGSTTSNRSTTINQAIPPAALALAAAIGIALILRRK